MKRQLIANSIAKLPILAAAAALASCSASLDDLEDLIGGGGAEDSRTYAMSTADTFSSRFEGDEPVTFTGKAKMLVRDWDNQTVTAAAQDITFKVVPLGANAAAQGEKSAAAAAAVTPFQVEVTMDGETVIFTQDDIKPGSGGFVLSKVVDGEEISIWNYTGTWDQVASGSDDLMTKYVMPLGGYIGMEDGVGADAYGVVGMETPEEFIAESSAKASYSGRLWSRFYRDDAPNGADRINMEADVALNADFGAAKISGKIDGMEFYDQEESWSADEEDGYWQINETDIVGNGFSTDLTHVGDEGNPGFVSSEFEGTFYGPEAEEAAGTMGFEVNPGDDITYVGSGVWSATKDAE